MNLHKKVKLFKHKSFEIQFTRWDYRGAGYNYGISFDLGTHQDNGGFSFRIDLGQFMFSFNLLDVRDWDIDANCYEGQNKLPVTEQNYEMPPCVDPNSAEGLKRQAARNILQAKEECRIWQEANL